MVALDKDSDEIKLKGFRYNLFEEIKYVDDFPYNLASELKLQKKPKLGESAALKLCSDIYTLVSVFEGAPFEDLKDLISSSKNITDNCNRSTCINETVTVVKCICDSKKNDADIAFFRSVLSDLQTEISTLRNENGELKPSLKVEINSIKEDVKSLKSNITDAVNKLQSTATFCRQSIENIGDEHSNGVASVKSDMKQSRDDIASIYEYTDIKDAKLFDKVSKFSSLDKRVTKLHNKVEQLNISNSNVTHSSSHVG